MAMYVNGGIHKRLDSLLKEIGGYDYKYHAKKIAEQLQLPVEGVIRIMELSSASNPSKSNFLFNKYLREYQEGIPLSKIETEEIDRIKRVTDSILHTTSENMQTIK